MAQEPIKSMLIENLTELRDNFKLLGMGWEFYDFMLTYGTFWKGSSLPKRYVRRTPKQCFYNGRQLVRRSKALKYCEGIACRPELPLPVHHAWAIGVDHRVIDPTWDRPETCEYLGIIFDRSLLTHSLRYSGQLFNEWGALRPDIFELLQRKRSRQEPNPAGIECKHAMVSRIAGSLSPNFSESNLIDRVPVDRVLAEAGSGKQAPASQAPEAPHPAR
jgi:hypothetical protein